MQYKDIDVVYELFKLSSTFLPEKSTWSIDQIYQRLFAKGNVEEVDKGVEGKEEKESKIDINKQQNPEILENLKQTLIDLEKKQAVIFADGFNSISFVEPKLAELIDI